MSQVPMPKDNSRGAANTTILDALRGAGEIGLLVDDLVPLLNFSASKDVKPRLFDLMNRHLIEQCEDDKWRIISPLFRNGSDNTTQDNTSQSTFKLPSVEMAALPQINLPGMPKFSSYKNSLQEYCQKKHMAVPQYHCAHESNGYVGTVFCFTNTVTAEKGTDNAKDADQLAAFAALKLLGYLPKDMKFEQTSLKRKETSMEGTPPNKQHCSGTNNKITTSKSRLNELAQKNQLPMPVYNTVAADNGFVSTVTFNGRQFKSSAVFPKKKEAEQSAAQVASEMLLDPSVNGTKQKQKPDQVADSDIKTMISEARSESTAITSLKNRLQEYCQRLRKALPQYDTVMQNGLCTSTVIVEGQTYTGASRFAKKAAEQAAAEVALKALGLMA